MPDQRKGGQNISPLSRTVHLMQSNYRISVIFRVSEKPPKRRR